MTRIRYGIALTAACSALLLTGCGGGGAVSTQSGSAPAHARDAGAEAYPANEATASRDQARPEKPAQAAGKSGLSGVEAAQQERQVIYTASMTVRAKQVATASQQAKQIVTEAGGHLSKEESDSAGGTEDSALLEFKIPPLKYPEVLARLGKEVGKQLSMKQSSQDVTLKVADVESRLKSAQESLESLRELLKRADTIGQVLEVEREITSRESDLESLQAQQKKLAAQTSMATLTLRLVGPVAVVEEPDDEPAGFMGGLESGWDALVSFTKVALTVLGALLPWLAASTPLIALLVWLVRRDRSARQRPATAVAQNRTTEGDA